MKKTIIFFKGIYDTLDLFSDYIQEAFSELGFGTFVYRAETEKQSKEALLAMLQKEKGDYAVVAFNNLGYNLDMSLPENVSTFEGIEEKGTEWSVKKENLVNVWEYYQIPYIDILMDHPFHFERPLNEMPSTAILLCVDRNHVKYIRRYYKNIRQVDFLPHAGIELGRKHKPLQDRKIDVLYAGALPIYTVAKMIPDLPEMYGVDTSKMMPEILRELVVHPDKTTEQAIEEYINASGKSLSEEELRQIIVHMRFVDSYATSFFREQAVRILVENGIEVTAYGVGWNQCDWSDNPYLKYGGKVMAPQILPLMNDSKIVLNTMTWFKAGAHDRIFNGMLAGAVVATDDSTYMNREFTDGKELILFKRTELGALPERICDLFGHLERAQEIANCGYQAARSFHLWKNRVEYIIECFL